MPCFLSFSYKKFQHTSTHWLGSDCESRSECTLHVAWQFFPSASGSS